jgi:hypothetical protein
MDVPPGSIRHVSLVRLRHVPGFAGDERWMQIVAADRTYIPREARPCPVRSDEAPHAADAR